MRIGERYGVSEHLRARYLGAGPVKKGQMLDSFCLASGYGRKYAVKVLRGRRRLPVGKPSSRAGRCSPGFRSGLKMCSESSVYLYPECSQPLLPIWS